MSKSILFVSVLYLYMVGYDSVSAQDMDTLEGHYLDELLITDHAAKLRQEAGIGTTVRLDPAQGNVAGVAASLSQIAGIWSDASTGEVFSRVHTRGISLSATDDIGWYYNALQEDGLPITMVQYQQFAPDFFMRPDISIDRLEVIRGGKSGILTQSGPAVSVNYISRQPTDEYHGKDRLTLGIYDGGRPMARIEGYHGGPIGKQGWAYDYSYLYRYDRGPREVSYAFNRGGQMKAGLSKKTKRGVFSLKGKWLDDQVNRYTGVAAQNWSSPQPAFGMSFQNSTLLVPGFQERNNRVGDQYQYDPSNGIDVQEKSLQFNADVSLGEWRLINRAKYSNKDIDWQTTIGGQPLGLDNFLTYFISGDAFPAGVVSFTEVATGTPIAIVDNSEAFGVFQGLPPGFEYFSGSLPNDAIMGSGAWKKDDSIDEWMNDLQLKRSWDQLSLTMGVFGASSQVDIFTNASFVYSTYEAQSRLLSVSLDNPGAPSRLLSDSQGLSNYGALFYEGADIRVNQYGVYSDVSFNISPLIKVDAGLRYHAINHSGTKDISAPNAADGGLDGNPLTSYDNGFLQPTDGDPIDFGYDYLSFSIGCNYKVADDLIAYGRYSSSHKAPELNYYINNFSNQEIPANLQIEIQDINQGEVGVAWGGGDEVVQIAGFWSQLRDVPFVDFVFDSELNQIFYTPTQLNGSTTIGAEVDAKLRISDHLSLRTVGTWQRGRLDQFTVYDPQGTISTDDDIVVDFEDNVLPHTPSIMLRQGINYAIGSWQASMAWNYMGARYGNAANAFSLPSYSTVDLRLDYQLSQRWSASLACDNLNNSGGLQNFFGPNEFGSNANAADQNYINSNPNGSFVVFPIMPRTIYLSTQYNY